MRLLPLFALVSCATVLATGRAWQDPCGRSVGVRPAAECGVGGCDGAGVTVQARGAWERCGR